MTNVRVDDINDSMLQRLPGRMHTLLSRDTIRKGLDLHTKPGQIHAANNPATPPHELHLKVEAMVMFIRDFNFNISAINGRQSVITVIHRNLII